MKECVSGLVARYVRISRALCRGVKDGILFVAVVVVAVCEGVERGYRKCFNMHCAKQHVKFKCDRAVK